MSDVVLVLNVGSSSIKFAAYDARDPESPPPLQGSFERLGQTPLFSVKAGPAAESFGAISTDDGHAALIERLIPWLEAALESGTIIAAGHRIVHGGRDYAEPVVIDDDICGRLEALAPLAPRHQPENLAGVRAVALARPDLPQIACFDTAFHRTQPRIAQLFAIPRALTDEGIIRYGFHGLSYEYIASVLPAHAGNRAHGRVIVAHLGHGASLCAMREGKSIATSMGFTALDGLVMGKRPGALDPGVVLHLIQDRGMSVEEVGELLHSGSGLLGVSQVSSDMRDLLGSGNEHAREAVDLFVYRATTEIGALAAALGGIDALVFTAGIGENAPEIRARICEGSRWLGLELDGPANEAGASRITKDASRASAWVIPTDEERIIARHTLKTFHATLETDRLVAI